MRVGDEKLKGITKSFTAPDLTFVIDLENLSEVEVERMVIDAQIIDGLEY